VLTAGNVYLFYYTLQGQHLIYIITSFNRRPTGSHIYTDKNKTTKQKQQLSPLLIQKP